MLRFDKLEILGKRFFPTKAAIWSDKGGLVGSTWLEDLLNYVLQMEESEIDILDIDKKIPESEHTHIWSHKEGLVNVPIEGGRPATSRTTLWADRQT